MAAPARVGLRNPNAASGRPTTLYTNAQNRFCLILRKVRRLASIAPATSLGSGRIRVMAAVSIATSVPVPSAMPTVARASAGASFTPSPTMPTLAPCSASSAMIVDLSSGRASPCTSSMPNSPPMRCATDTASPDTSSGVTWSRLSCSTAALACGRNSSTSSKRASRASPPSRLAPSHTSAPPRCNSRGGGSSALSRNSRSLPTR